MSECIHDWTFIGRLLKGHELLFKCDKCAEVLEEFDAADYINVLEEIIAERDVLIERLIEAGEKTAKDVEDYVRPAWSAVTWRALVAERQSKEDE